MICKNCGNEIDNDSKFCTICGMNVEYKMETQNLNMNAQNNPNMQMPTWHPYMANPPQNPRRKMSPVFILIIVILVVIIGVIGVNSYNYQNRDPLEKSIDAIESWFE